MPGPDRPDQEPAFDRDSSAGGAADPLPGGCFPADAQAGLSWCWQLDFESLISALNSPAPWNRSPRPSGRGAASSRIPASASASGDSALDGTDLSSQKPSAGADQEATNPDAAHHGATDHKAADHAAADDGATNPDAADHKAADHGAADHGAADHGAADHGAADHGAADHGAADDEAADDEAADDEAANQDAEDLDAEDQDAVLDAVEQARAAGRVREVPAGVVAGRVAECLPAGADLAGWLATAARDLNGLEDGALAGVAASFRRLAAWAQAGELAAVAQIASRSAAADPKIGTDVTGQPARVPDEAVAQVSLALVMSQGQAAWWTHLGVTLAWRLAATGAALAAGEIDLSRARLMAEATEVLGEDAARAVEERILPKAAGVTTSGLRAALRRAVIAADPDGAERRRQASQERATVMLYPDPEGTASLAGYRLPGIGAAAAMARISALARALRASGAGGGIDLLRAQVFLGLLCGTLPLIPPPPGAPPGDDPPPEDGDLPPADEPRPEDDRLPADDDSPPPSGHGRPFPGAGPPADGRSRRGGPPSGRPPPGRPSSSGPSSSGPSSSGPSSSGPPRDGPPGGRFPGSSPPDARPPDNPPIPADPRHRGGAGQSSPSGTREPVPPGVLPGQGAAAEMARAIRAMPVRGRG
jgi:hypothetical protein